MYFFVTPLYCPSFALGAVFPISWSDLTYKIAMQSGHFWHWSKSVRHGWSRHKSPRRGVTRGGVQVDASEWHVSLWLPLQPHYSLCPHLVRIDFPVSGHDLAWVFDFTYLRLSLVQWKKKHDRNLYLWHSLLTLDHHKGHVNMVKNLIQILWSRILNPGIVSLSCTNPYLWLHTWLKCHTYNLSAVFVLLTSKTC